MKIIQEIKYQMWKKRQIKKEIRHMWRQLSEWESKKSKEQDSAYREKYERFLNPYGNVRDPADILKDINEIVERMRK